MILNLRNQSEAAMRTVTFDNPHRRRHFEFFRDMNHPHFSVCAHLPVGPWVHEAKARDLRLTSSLVYLLSRAANAIPEFRQRIRDNEVVEHHVVHPSFTVATDEADVFSFCEVELGDDMAVFLARADQQIAAMCASPSIEDVAGRDDYLFMSPFPWVSFTSVSHAMQLHPHDSVPRITWGKLYNPGNALMLPVSVQAHHAVVDGVHMGRFFEGLEALASKPAELMGTDTD
jgi:chloramphenicol O-acetyltransferase type A